MRGLSSHSYCIKCEHVPLIPSVSVHGPYPSSFGLTPCFGVFVGCCFSCDCCGVNALGNVVRVYPETVQGLMFYRSEI